jgi:hypothetical protein
MDFERPSPKGEVETPLPKGTCPKCKKHIGKGYFKHVKACDGHPEKAG